jgi:hypothetical protein
LDSIASQSLLPDELVVCDDGSVDDTLILLREFVKQSPFPVRLYVNQSNLGSTRNFEEAIQLCGGDVIALADQDDVWRPRKLEVLLDTLEMHPRAGYAFSDADVVNDMGVPLLRSWWEAVGFHAADVKQFLAGHQLALLLKRNVVTGAGMAIRASLKSSVLPIPSRWVHDYWIALLGSTFGHGVPVPEQLFTYRQHASQQIGPRHTTPLKDCKISLTATAEDAAGKLERFLEFQQRVLAASAFAPCPSENIEWIREKGLHLGRRAAIRSRSGIQEVATVLSEAVTGRYMKFSDSWRSILRDLLSCFAKLPLPVRIFLEKSQNFWLPR